MRIRLRDAQLTLATVGFERYAKTTRLDRLWSTSIQVTKVVNVDIGREITKEKERIGEALARVDAQRERLNQSAQRTGGDRTGAGALHQGTRTTRSKVGLNPGDQGGRPSAGTRAPPHYDRRTRRRRTHSRWLRSRQPAIR